MTCEMLEVISEDLIKEFNNIIEKEKKSTLEVKKSKVCTKKELDILESRTKSLECQLKESCIKV